MKKKIFIILIVVLFSLQIIVFSVRNREVSDWLGAFKMIAVPFHRGWLVVQHGLTRFMDSFASKRKLIEENTSLQKEIGQLQNELAILTEQIRELNMKLAATTIESQMPFDVIPALVIGRDPYDWFGKIIIDKGKKNGIALDLTVVTYQGLVGRVDQVYDNYSVVRLLLSPDIATGAIVQRTRDLGVVEGNGKGLCIMRYIYRTSQVQVGDLVVTSGLGISTPRGIVIGKVLDVKDSVGSLFKEVTVQPECDFSLIEQLFVIHSSSKGEKHDNQ
jgi:rod shape-determining protein MreC